MLVFGWISDKIGRKFGMVRTTPATSDAPGLSLLRWPLLELLLFFLPSLRHRPGLTIMPLASLLCCVHVGESANDDTPLTAANSIPVYSFLLGIGVGAEYPCGSVAASEQSEEEGIAKNAQHRWFALATSAKQSLVYPVTGGDTYVTFLDTMIDFGFVISSFVPVVLFWMWALTSIPFGNLFADSSQIWQ
jgi:MFS family permease